MVKHWKPSRLATFVGDLQAAPPADDVENLTLYGLDWDDRRLGDLAGRVVLGGGVDNDDPYRALPLDRWDDRKVREWPRRDWAD